MSARANLSEVEDRLNKIISFSIAACCDLPFITLSHEQHETYKKFNRPDVDGEYYYKNILLKRGRH